MQNDSTKLSEGGVPLASLSPSGVSLVAFSHMVNDLYASALAPVLPLLVSKLGLSLAMVGGLGAAQMIMSVLQPLWGYLSDRWMGRLFLFMGPLMAAVGIGAIGLAPNYTVLIVLAMLIGIGSALFHPIGASAANAVSGDRKGLGMSIFMAAGALGRGAGPLTAVFVVTAFGLDKTWVLLLPGLLLLAGVRVLPPTRPAAADLDLRAAGREFTGHLRPLFLLWSIIALRVSVDTSLMTFLPLFLTARGASLRLSGSAVSVYLFAGAVGSLLGGYLADRFGARRTTAGSVLIAAPMLHVALHTRGVVSLAGLAVAGLCLMAGHPINLVIAQELVPRHASTVSGFMMGVAFAFGGVVAGLVGWVADHLGLALTLDLLAATVLLAAPCALSLPQSPRPATATPAEVEPLPLD